MRIALGIEYNGLPYKGWQIQPRVPTVQGELEAALSQVADTPIREMQVAGRTDAGVHASGQVVHFDTTAARTEHAWIMGANHFLVNQHISVLWAKKMPDTFHARFSARARRYRYIIMSRKIRPAFLAHQVAWIRYPLRLDMMQAACRYLLGEHDFNAYRSVECQAQSPVKTIYEIKITQQGAFFYLDIEANSFLHHMVRNIAGVLIAIGRELKPPEWAQDVLLSRDRTCGGMTAPANGLYLTQVRYDAVYNLPQTELLLPGFYAL